MRISLVIFFCLLIVVVNSATSKTTRRAVLTTARRGTTKAPARKSAYTYLRSVRGKSSCAGGSCPFWERHGRSFVSLRCYAEQYRECTCLHRMCFSSCLFSRQVCNEEMVSCLRQICPRCMPASATSMCAVYDSMAARVAQTLSQFACYACCPNLPGSSSGNSTTTRPLLTRSPPINNGIMSSGSTTPRTGAVRPANGVSQNGGTNAVNSAAGLTSGGNRPVNSGAGLANGGNRPVNSGTGSANGGSRPVNSGAGSTNGGNRPVNGNTNSANGGNRPTNGGTGATNNGVNRPAAGNQGNSNVAPVVLGSNPSNSNNNGANSNQRVQNKVRTTRRIVTTRRPATVRTTVRAQKKPQANNGIKN